MSMQAINYALTLPVDESGPRLALILIAHHVNWKTGDMFVSQEELAKEVRCNVRTIRRYVDFLLENEFIQREEQRSKEGRRSVDRISLVGYLDWQNIIDNGGMMPNPKTRGKQAANLSGSQPPTGQMVSVQPDKWCKPTGQQVSGINKPFSNQKINHSSANDLDLKGSAKAEFAISLADSAQWNAWMHHLRLYDEDLAKRAEAAGVIKVTSRWPREGERLVSIPKAAGLTARSKQMAGHE